MKLFLGIVLVGALAVAGWLLLGYRAGELASRTPTPLAELGDETPSPFVTQSTAPTVTVTPQATLIPGQTPRVTVIPRRSPTPIPTPTPQGTPAPLFVTMHAINGSGQFGVATVAVSESGNAIVAFNLNGSPVNVSQPAYIYRGTCAATQEIVYALNPVFNGASNTTLNASFADIFNWQGSLAVVVHASGSNSLRYSCGQLR